VHTALAVVPRGAAEMTFLEEARARHDAVCAFVQEPSFPALNELKRHRAQLLQALEPPQPNVEDRERVRARAVGVPEVPRLSDTDVTLVPQLSDFLHVNELLAARLLTDTLQVRNPAFSFPCARATRHGTQRTAKR
jgi:hypothetical protein